MTLLAPSLLAANYMALGESIRDAELAGADYLHIDVMDGHFVPNLTFGIDMVSEIAKAAKIPLDVHLMLENPELFIEQFAAAGAKIISVHIEACPHIHRIIHQIKEAGCQAGVVLNPGTAGETLTSVLSEVDLVLQMTVNPGYGGQLFIPGTLSNIAFFDQYRKENGLHYRIEVDGGINQETADLCKDAGVDILVAGSYFFQSADKKDTADFLKK